MTDRLLSLRQLEAQSARIAKKRNRLEQTLAEQMTVETAYRERVESFVLETARATGVTSLPLQKIVDAFRDLGGAGKEVDAEQVQSVESTETKRVDASHRPRGGSISKASKNDDLVEVSVKVGNRVKGDDRRALVEAKLHWNGKHGRWIGVVAAATVAALRERFPDRFAVGSPSRAIVEIPPQDTAAVGDPTTATDTPMPVETVPAGGIGLEVPHTPPVGHIDTRTAAPAGGAVTGGAGAASDDTKEITADTTEAPAPVQPPMGAKPPAPRSAVRFPNFPRAGARG